MSYEVQCEGRVAVTRSISRAVLGQASQTHMACGLRSPETMCVCLCVCVGGCMCACVCVHVRASTNPSGDAGRAEIADPSAPPGT
jgi:hypothetical protein